MRPVWMAMSAIVLATVVACSGSSSSPPTGPPDATSSPSSSPSTSPSTFAEDCPDVTGADGSAAAIDYVDFIQAFGRQYVAGTYSDPNVLSFTAKATRADLGRIVLRSKCSFSALNDRTQKSPGEPRDGDTGFLPPGTPIYALHGWSTSCRLAAVQDGHLKVYLAYRNDTEHARARWCALGHPM